MNRRKEKFLEAFILGMFPVALIVGCSTNGNDSSVSQSSQNQEQHLVSHEQVLNVDDLSHLTFVDDQTSEPNETGKDMAMMQLAVYKHDPTDPQSATTEQVNFSKLPVNSNLKKFVFHFNSGEYNLAREDLDELAAHADFLRNNPEFSLTLNGHSDQVGPEQTNLKLSEQRARYIAEILMTFGVKDTQLDTVGHGETAPLNNASNLDENRRVELEYSKSLMLSSM